MTSQALPPEEKSGIMDDTKSRLGIELKLSLASELFICVRQRNPKVYAVKTLKQIFTKIRKFIDSANIYTPVLLVRVL